MQLLISSCIAWITIILFSIIPKKLSILDFVFLYCVLLCLTSTSFTMFELNFNIITFPMLGLNLWAVTIYRLVTSPLLILMIFNALQPSEERKTNWTLSIAIWIGLTTYDWTLDHFKMIKYQTLYVWTSIGIAYLCLILITWGLLKWYKRFDYIKKEEHT